MFLLVGAALPLQRGNPYSLAERCIAAPVIVVDQGPLDKDLLDVGVVAYIGSVDREYHVPPG